MEANKFITEENNTAWKEYTCVMENFQQVVNRINPDTRHLDDCELIDVWKVQMPDFSLRDLRYNVYFGRNRWFVENTYATDASKRVLLRPTTPGFIEQQWETWNHQHQPWLTLLQMWTPQWLQTRFGNPLASLQLLVDVADHLRMRNLLPPLSEKSRTTTALLISAESLLKWPAHYLTRLHLESVHPLGELRPHSVLLWNQTKIRLEYLQRCATNFSLTQKLALELHKDLIQQLTRAQTEHETTEMMSTMQILPARGPTSNMTWFSAPEPLVEPPPVQTPESTPKRKRTPVEQLLKDMRIRCKEYRHEEPYFNMLKKDKK